MRISVTEAKGQLTELVRRAEAGDEVVPYPSWPCDGHAGAGAETPQRYGAAQGDCRDTGRRCEVNATCGASAARSQDILYGANGLPK